jgi:membrane-bound ClpP family serine protease
MYAEFFFPGGVLALMAVASFAMGFIILIDQISSGWQLFFASLAALGSVGLIVKLALWRLSRSQKEGIMQKASQTGYTASSFDTNLMGKQALAVTDLRPAGYIKIDLHRLNASTEGEFIQAGSFVKIIGGEGAYLIVSPLPSLKKEIQK